MADVSKIKIGDTTYDIKDTTARGMTINTNQINNLAVTENKIANNAVTLNKIADNAITSNKIADNTILFTNLSDAVRNGYVRVFNTVAEMQAATDLSEGMICHTNGFYIPEDNGAGYYVISSNETANGMNILECQNDLFAVLTVTEGYVTPEMYGAYGDYIHDDTISINTAFASGWRVECRPTVYKVNEILMQNLNNITINGNGGTFKRPYENSARKTILGIVTCTDININNLNITTDFDPTTRTNDIGDLYNDGPYGISANEGCSRISITECRVSYVVDGIGANDSNSITIAKNYIHDVGQEPIAVRQTYDTLITENHCYAHLGDGILVKYYTSQRADKSCNIIISNNTLYDPKQCTPTGKSLQCGGGITVNAENDPDQAQPTRGIVICNNTVDGCRYGVQLTNVVEAVIDGNTARVGLVNNNFIGGSCAFGIAMSKEWTAITSSSIESIDRILFSNNIAVGGRALFRSYSSGNDVAVTNIIFDGNVGNCLKIGDTVYPSSYCVEAWNTTFTNNIVSGAQAFGRFYNCIVKNNQFLDPNVQGDHQESNNALTGNSTLITPANPQNSDIQFRGTTCVVEGNIIDGHQLYCNCGGTAVLRNNNFNFSELQGLKLQCPDNGYILLEGNLYNGLILTKDNLYRGGKTANILTDFYLRYSITDGSNAEIGNIQANRDTIMLYLDTNYNIGNAIHTVTDPYFRPNTSNKQMPSYTINGTTYGVARTAYTTAGVITVMASPISSGTVIVNATMHK